MGFLDIQVEAYSGYRANERPTAFIYEGQRHIVAKVVDRWYEGGLSSRDQKVDYFKVITEEGFEYILRYLPLFDSWSLMVSREP